MSFQLPATTTAAATGFSFGLSSTPAAATNAAIVKPTFGSTGGGDAGIPKLSFGAPTITTTTSANPTLGLGAAPPSFSFGAPAASAPSLSLAPTTTTASLQKTTAAPATTTAAPAGGGGFVNLSTATKTTDSSKAAIASQMSYNQLEEHINKWTLELEEQEKVFTDQATQINAWDKILISNNHKILELNDAVQKVKTDQQTLEQELEFIATQHKELEESIVPLQNEFLKIPQVDVERSQTYLLVENLDSQLKQMSEDLKEIIDSLNEANKGQDNNDPIMQIGKILNAHMSSLQWIESSSSGIVNKLDDITKMHETFKRDSERSFRSAYYN